MTRRYPLMLDLAGRRCLVVGGGQVAARKVRGLLAAGAEVEVVAPEVGEGLRRLADEGLVTLAERPFATADAQGALLVFAATDRAEVNNVVAASARAAGALANQVDLPGGGDFQVPAVAEAEGLLVAISTGGRSPAFAAALRREVERLLSPERLALLELYAGARAEAKATNLATDELDWERLATEPLLELLRAGQTGAARAALLRQLGAANAALEAR